MRSSTGSQARPDPDNGPGADPATRSKIDAQHTATEALTTAPSPRADASGASATGTAAEATAAATAAAAQAGVHVVLAGDHDRLHEVAALLAEVWGTSPDSPPLAPDLLRVVAHSGGSVIVADGAAGLVGAAVAIFCAPARRRVYSMIAATRARDRGVGYALKLAQRAWALRHGANSVVWTFDPLLRRNARFNLVKLGAVAEEYLVDFYGRLDDEINGPDETDRLTVVWPLDRLESGGGGAGTGDAFAGPRGTPERVGPDGGPLVFRDGREIWCRIPDDIVALRRSDPAMAGRWRQAVRQVFTTAYGDGLVATAMSRDGWYHLTPPESAPGPDAS